MGKIKKHNKNWGWNGLPGLSLTIVKKRKKPISREDRAMSFKDKIEESIRAHKGGTIKAKFHVSKEKTREEGVNGTFRLFGSGGIPHVWATPKLIKHILRSGKNVIIVDDNGKEDVMATKKMLIIVVFNRYLSGGNFLDVEVDLLSCFFSTEVLKSVIQRGDIDTFLRMESLGGREDGQE